MRFKELRQVLPLWCISRALHYCKGIRFEGTPPSDPLPSEADIIKEMGYEPIPPGSNEYDYIYSRGVDVYHVLDQSASKNGGHVDQLVMQELSNKLLQRFDDYEVLRVYDECDGHDSWLQITLKP